jgi:hypothetical protein
VEQWLDIGAIARDLAYERAANREEALCTLMRRNLPRPLRWLTEHPRLLWIALRLRPAWRLTVTVGTDAGRDGLTRVEMAHCRDGTSYVLP